MLKFNQIENFRILSIRTNYDKLRDLLYIINGIIMNYNDAYAFPEMVIGVQEELVSIFRKVSELKPKCEVYINDMLKTINFGKAMVMSLSKYNRTFQYDESCKDAAIISAKYQVFSFLKKRDSLDVHSAFSMMRRNLHIKNAINSINEKMNDNINVPAFNRLQNDIMSMLINKVESYAFAS